ncbi:MAG: 3-oxoacyl-ACP reductase FabG [Oligoflexales bacterium]|nr:3-oxoacyl-ACP reductase FabG [Oligoflexales bacterium]
MAADLTVGNKDKHLQKVALVTGASRGIGAACAKALALAGYRVAIHYRSDEALAKGLQAELSGSQIYRFDLSQPDACKELCDKIKTEMGGIDVLVNNAGMSIDALLPFAKEDDFDKLLSVNLKPVFVLSKYASKHMIRKKAGRIINISSVVGVTGNAGQTMYSATKAAIIGMTKSMALELAGFGILANCVAPGFIATEMTSTLSAEAKEKIFEKIPLKRLGTAEDIASAVAFLASDSANYITGTTLHVNGGMYTN